MNKIDMFKIIMKPRRFNIISWSEDQINKICGVPEKFQGHNLEPEREVQFMIKHIKSHSKHISTSVTITKNRSSELNSI